MTKKQQIKAEQKKKAFFFERVWAYKRKVLDDKARVLSQATFSSRQLEKFRELLESQKSILTKERRNLSKELGSELCLELEKNRSGNHQGDTNTEGSLVTQSLVCNRQKRLEKIDAAISRLENGTFGICLECCQPIATGRLLTTPIADLCQQCKEEKEEKERRDDGRINSTNHYQKSASLSQAQASA